MIYSIIALIVCIPIGIIILIQGRRHGKDDPSDFMRARQRAADKIKRESVSKNFNMLMRSNTPTITEIRQHFRT